MFVYSSTNKMNKKKKIRKYYYWVWLLTVIQSAQQQWENSVHILPIKFGGSRFSNFPCVSEGKHVL